jgi:HEPN domain-containing protein
LKARVLNLFDLAERDAEEADRCVATSPNLAAFHAQQCAEKSLKAFCLELSDIKDSQEEDFLKKIGHASARAVMKSIGQILKELFERSGVWV